MALVLRRRLARGQQDLDRVRERGAVERRQPGVGCRPVVGPRGRERRERVYDEARHGVTCAKRRGRGLSGPARRFVSLREAWRVRASARPSNYQKQAWLLFSFLDAQLAVSTRRHASRRYVSNQARVLMISSQ